MGPEPVAESGSAGPPGSSARVAINVPRRGSERLAQVIRRVNADDDLYALWLASNVNAMERLGMSDHGPVHVKIVMNIALKILRLLGDNGVEPAIVRDHGMEKADAEVVVALAALLHDVGMSIHRADHEGFSLFIAETKVRQLLDGIYEPRAATIVRSEVLHAIISHRSGGMPLTLEAGIVRVADALDMAEGRSRIPFTKGSPSIHSISAAAIDAIDIAAGGDRPVRVCVHMSNSAGVFHAFGIDGVGAVHANEQRLLEVGQHLSKRAHVAQPPAAARADIRLVADGLEEEDLVGLHGHPTTVVEVQQDPAGALHDVGILP